MATLAQRICYSSLRSSWRTKTCGIGMCAVSRSKHTLPDLPYDYGALEPVLSAEIMQVHHQKHHATYVNNLNMFEEKLHEALVKGDVKAAIRFANSLKFNAGGHVNHSILWTMLAKDGGEPSSELLAAINQAFGTLDAMKDKLSAASTAVQGSGWGWLAYEKESKQLRIVTCPNQEVLESATGLIPLFGIDVWEHAYYLQYRNLRPDYAKAVWKIANWKNINERYEKAIA